MAYFYSIRGWLELEPEGFSKIISEIKFLQNSSSEETKLGLYVRGWCWGKAQVNWSRYLFYGADVSEEGLDLFQDMLDKLLAMGLNISGYFHAQGEDGTRNLVYWVTDDKLKIDKGKILVAVT